jgi:hypothetical protein
MPKSPPWRNATEVENRRFLKGITGQNAGQIVTWAVAAFALAQKCKNPPDPFGIERAH